MFSITIDAAHSHEGACLGEYPDLESLEDVEAVVVEIYAGYAAQLRYNPAAGGRRRGWAADDDEKAEELLDLSGLGSVSEERLRVLASDLVDENWHLVAALAPELLRYRQLDLFEAELIPEESSGRAEATQELANYRRLLVR